MATACGEANDTIPTSTGAPTSGDAVGSELTPDSDEGAALRAELESMLADDQAERGVGPPGRVLTSTDQSRAARMREIIEAYGWPTRDLVGRRGSTAAWTVVQHADFDLDFQRTALALMREAVARKQADPVELAYLTDRVAVNSAQPQTYGTQVRCRGGKPQPATPIRDPEKVDRDRADLGLPPLADYVDQLRPACQRETHRFDSLSGETGPD